MAAEWARRRRRGDPNRPLTAVEVAARLRRRPGWDRVEDGSAILCNYRFLNASGPLLFFNFLAATLRRSPFDVDFVFDLDALDVGVGLGAESFVGVTPAIFALARLADTLALVNFGAP
jgi:hypothetical protein